MEFTILYKSDYKLATSRLWSRIIIVIHIDIDSSPKVVQKPDAFNVELHEEEVVICKGEHLFSPSSLISLMVGNNSFISRKYNSEYSIQSQ